MSAVLQGVSPFEAGGRWLSYFSRPSSGTYLDDSGVLQVAPVDVPRVDFSSGKGELLIEGASTNYVPNGSTLAHSNSNGSLGFSADVPVLLQGQGAVKVFASSGPILLAAPLTIPTTGVYTASIWYWLPESYNANDFYITVNGANGTSTGGAYVDISRRGEWVRVVRSGTLDAGDATFYCVGDGATDTTVMYFTCAQVEPGDTATSYIPTTGAVASRAADVALFVAPPPLPAPSRTLNARTPDQALLDLLALSPPGDGMPRTADTIWAQMLSPLAGAISDVEESMGRFATEIDPATALFLLPDYERVLGPDPFGRDPATMTVAQRQQLAFSRWVQKYGVRPADFVKMAADLGVTITIDEFFPAQCGRAQCGVAACLNAPTQFSWLVTLPKADLQVAQCGVAQCGLPISFFEVSFVAGVIARRAPSYTSVFFTYTG